MPIPPEVAIATRNAHKVGEIRAICASWPTVWRTADERWPDVEETGRTYLDNARLKAHAVATATGIPALADDSGIEVDALGGAPGPRSARYAGDDASDAENLAALLDAVRGVPGLGRGARYRCVVVLAFPDGTELSTEGVCEGGFGYDPAFVPAGWEVTLAELAPGEKDRISHRGRALRALRALLETD
ncbi:MAG: non-canonical purine NTP pyrophosphatase [Actinomycetota bacterium]